MKRGMEHEESSRSDEEPELPSVSAELTLQYSPRKAPEKCRRKYKIGMSDFKNRTYNCTKNHE